MAEMRRPIELDDPNRSIPVTALNAPGGFTWWYAEIADGNGNGIVLIWAFGLPFIPGWASSARRGQARPARACPSLNVVVYEAGQPSMYVLRELDEAHADYEPGCPAGGGDPQLEAGRWRFGETTMVAQRDDGHLSLDVHLNVPVGGCDAPLTGRIRLAGPMPTGMPVEPGAGHRWTPLCLPGFGTALLKRPDGSRLSLTGRAYHDRNSSPVPLHDLGIKRWLWGRVGHGGNDGVAERVFYVLDGHDGDRLCFGLTFTNDGCVTRHPLTATLSGEHRTFYGLHAPRLLALSDEGAPFATVALEEPVDDGPFYRRYLPEVVGEPDAAACVELIEPDRIDLPQHRPLVKMRVASEQRPNSMWLPLFQGASDGRVGRLLASWNPLKGT